MVTNLFLEQCGGGGFADSDCSLVDNAWEAWYTSIHAYDVALCFNLLLISFDG